MRRVAVIGGTGMKQLVAEADLSGSSFSITNTDSTVAETDYGDVPVEIISLDNGDEEAKIFIIHRHHGEEGAITPPHLINYHANVKAAQATQPDAIVSIQSVGSMDPLFPPGIVGMAMHTLDLVSNPVTFSEENAHHADMTNHYPAHLRDLLRDVLLLQRDEELSLDHVVSHVNGPQFETPAEIDAFHRLGATAASMTISPEARLVAETGIPHIGLIASSNWAAGKNPLDADAEIDHFAIESMASDMRGVIWQCFAALLEE